MSAREELFHMIAGVSNDGSRPWCDEARRILDVHAAEVRREDADSFERYPWHSDGALYDQGRDAAITWVVSTLRRRAEVEEKTTAEAAASGFFQPGHRYAHSQWHFHCATVTAHPGTGERSAIGWLQISDGSWTTYAYSEAAWGDSWVDVTGQVAE